MSHIHRILGCVLFLWIQFCEVVEESRQVSFDCGSGGGNVTMVVLMVLIVVVALVVVGGEGQSKVAVIQ